MANETLSNCKKSIPDYLGDKIKKNCESKDTLQFTVIISSIYSKVFGSDVIILVLSLLLIHFLAQVSGQISTIRKPSNNFKIIDLIGEFLFFFLCLCVIVGYLLKMNNQYCESKQQFQIFCGIFFLID